MKVKDSGDKFDEFDDGLFGKYILIDKQLFGLHTLIPLSLAFWSVIEFRLFLKEFHLLKA